jgi:hypothetical protein
MSNAFHSFLKTVIVLHIGFLVVGSCPHASRNIATFTDAQIVFPIRADRIFENEKIINFFSIFTKEPEDATDKHRIPDTNAAGYLFPIDEITRYRDSNREIRLDGVIHVYGDASAIALPLLNQFFSNAGGTSRLGTQYVVRIRFEPGVNRAGNAVQINWLSDSELREFTAENQVQNNSSNAKMVVGFTRLGSRTVRINPVYASARSMKYAFANWPINSKQLRDTIKHTRGVFAHEMAHAMGLSHMRNRTNSIVSYAYGRKVTGDDAQAICLLVTNGDKKLCPE